VSHDGCICNRKGKANFYLRRNNGHGLRQASSAVNPDVFPQAGQDFQQAGFPTQLGPIMTKIALVHLETLHFKSIILFQYYK
jgi:hypothetical protein